MHRPNLPNLHRTSYERATLRVRRAIQGKYASNSAMDRREIERNYQYFRIKKAVAPHVVGPTIDSSIHDNCCAITPSLSHLQQSAFTIETEKRIPLRAHATNSRRLKLRLFLSRVVFGGMEREGRCGTGAVSYKGRE